MAGEAIGGEIISGERRLPLEALMLRAARAARGLESLGVGEGDTLAILMRNDIEFEEASFAARMLSAIAVPVNWHFKAEEVRYILEDSGAKVLVAHADLLEPCRAALPGELPVLAVPTPPDIAAAYGLNPAQCRLPPGATEWSGWLEGFEPWRGARKPSTAMIYTSGTTGRPKGVRREASTPEQEAHLMRRVQLVFGIRPGMRTVIPAPLYHSAPKAYAGLTALVGGTIVLQHRFDPEEFLALVERHAITSVQMVPTMFVRLLKLPEAIRGRYDLSSLEHIVHAAAPCPPEVKEAMIQWLGPIINEYYGSTEAGIVTYCTSPETLERPGTVGRAVEGVTLKILGEDGEELKAGEIGELYMIDPAHTQFTYHGNEAKRREIERGGLITNGDLGYLDPEGYLFLSDRRTDMVISGGVNIYPAEIEAVLVQHPAVADCAVFGIPDDHYGEALLGIVQPAPGAAPDAEELTAYLAQRLADYKVPRRIEFRGQLPREDTGKIFKRRLRDPYWENVSRNI